MPCYPTHGLHGKNILRFSAMTPYTYNITEIDGNKLVMFLCYGKHTWHVFAMENLKICYKTILKLAIQSIQKIAKNAMD